MPILEQPLSTVSRTMAGQFGSTALPFHTARPDPSLTSSVLEDIGDIYNPLMAKGEQGGRQRDWLKGGVGSTPLPPPPQGLRLRVHRCCVPSGCQRYNTDPIFSVTFPTPGGGAMGGAVGGAMTAGAVSSSGPALRVICSGGAACASGGWVHGDCLEAWERRLLGGAADRGRGDQQQRARVALWTRQALPEGDVACPCGMGRLRRDMEYHPSPLTGGLVAGALLGALRPTGDGGVSFGGKDAMFGSMRSGGGPVMLLNQQQSVMEQQQQQQQQLQTFSSSSTLGVKPLCAKVLARAAEMRGLAVEGGAQGAQELCAPDLRIRTFSYSSTGSSPPSSGTHSPPPTPPRDCGGSTSASPPPHFHHDPRHWPQGVSPPPIAAPTPPFNGAKRPHAWSPARQVPAALPPASHPALLQGNVTKGIPVPPSGKPPLQLGNMFRHRGWDVSSLRALPRAAQNIYQVRVDDEGPHGNDPTRGVLLKQLSRARVTCVPCVVCAVPLPVYDEFPLIDGTFFLSPKRYNSDIALTHERKAVYLNAVCLGCLDGTRGSTLLNCVACGNAWRGQTLVVGSLYTYDVFAAMACCPVRSACTGCGRPVVNEPPRFFSDCSKATDCPHCGKNDYHYAKPLGEVFSFRKIS